MITDIAKGDTFGRARAAFDDIALGIYYGMAARQAIASDPKVLEAAETLAATLRLVADRIKGGRDGA